MDLKGKKLLVLAGASVHNKVVRAAKEMGVYTIVTDYLEPELSPAKLLADEYWMLNITQVDEIVEKCREEHIDGVLAFCIDPAQRPYQEICERLGLPCYGTKEQFDILTDKRLFKRFLTDHNVDVIPEYSLEDIESGKVNYPLFIKPSISRGSRGQSICNNKEEAIAAIAKACKESNDGHFVCEQYMGDKQDMASAFYVVDGEPYLIKFGDRHLGSVEDRMDKQVMCTWLPCEQTQMFEANCMQKVKDMIKALGIKFGPVFMQGFFDGDTVRYYDPGLRMPGGDYDVVLKAATGFDTCKSSIHFALTGDTKTCFGDPKDCYKLNGGIGCLICFSVRPGKMHKVVGLEELQNNPNVIYARQIIPEGETIPDSGDVRQRVAAAGVYVKDKNEIHKFIQYLYDTYHVYDENGKDMIISKFTPKQ